MKYKKIVIADSYGPGRELISQYCKDLGIKESEIYHASTFEDLSHFTNSDNDVPHIILAESEILDEYRRRICTSDLLRILKKQGHTVIVHSGNLFDELNENMKNLIRSGVCFVPKSSGNFECEYTFQDVVLAPGLEKSN